MILCDFSSFHHPSTSHKSSLRFVFCVLSIPQECVVSRAVTMQKNEEQNGRLVTPVLYYSKSYLLFRFNLVTTFSIRTSRVRAFCAHEWRLREDESSTVGPRMPCLLLLEMFDCFWDKALLALRSAMQQDLWETKCAWRWVYSQGVWGVGWRGAELSCWHMPYPNLLLPSGLWPRWLFNNVNRPCD